MKKLALAMACVLAVGIAQAEDKGGFSQDAAPPPPHKLDDGYRGVEDGRIMTVEQAKTMHDGATISLRGNLLTRGENDRYQFRDKSGTITAIIPAAAFNEQHVEPDDLVSINGSLDRKMTPPVVRVDRLLKQSPK
ncbi:MULTISPECIES: YdeI family stress tolerance OB fold protein [Klebsiella]|uniref:YdeI family stress tolerance OB fold protein n=1 Tax=Klebsiella TaxID=570 RepID=UPI0007D0BB72|nr:MULTISPECIES: YdeI family stress tolerance OB fold protein [Klebsiella]HCB0183700.1 YdeI family stress tolerance OB fold protein [Klebsiella variicola subsp. variicola]EIY5008034.1 YdeI family stress tolerance OB fold protein [Klebsiella variicola]MCQ3883261.1 YdeI family stress tolerance OB fold protein [Klebsiella variicola]PJR57211.1 TIGR00156 family protein [Klebsiella sp. I-Nf8]PJR66866.1 TIGR00156 family protein [Klebsiella sp. K-Nf6]